MGRTMERNSLTAHLQLSSVNQRGDEQETPWKFDCKVVQNICGLARYMDPNQTWNQT